MFRMVAFALVSALLGIVAVAVVLNFGTQKAAPRFNTLHQAAAFDAGCIEAIAATGANVDALDAAGHTPLWIAVRNDNLPAVEKLLMLGADPNAGDLETDGPLLTSVFMGSQPADTLIAKQLIAAGADVDVASSQYEERPLHRAVRAGNLELVKVLVGAGANLDAQSSKGDTPLQWAVVRGNDTIAEVLLASGTDPELRNDAGFRPIDQLNVCPNPESVRAVFAAYGADDQRRPELLTARR